MSGIIRGELADCGGITVGHGLLDLLLEVGGKRGLLCKSGNARKAESGRGQSGNEQSAERFG